MSVQERLAEANKLNERADFAAETGKYALYGAFFTAFVNILTRLANDATPDPVGNPDPFIEPVSFDYEPLIPLWVSVPLSLIAAAAWMYVAWARTRAAGIERGVQATRESSSGAPSMGPATVGEEATRPKPTPATPNMAAAGDSQSWFANPAHRAEVYGAVGLVAAAIQIFGAIG